MKEMIYKTILIMTLFISFVTFRILGNYDRQTDQPTISQYDMRVHREVTLPTTECMTLIVI